MKGSTSSWQVNLVKAHIMTIHHTFKDLQAHNAADNKLKLLEFIGPNRNLMNWPIARHSRSRLKWSFSRKRNYRRCEINDRLTLQLPFDCAFKRRHATGFDMAVLLTLTALARARKGGKLRISRLDILAFMNLPPHSRNRINVASALRFWEQATLIWSGWYAHGRTQEQYTFERIIRCKPDGIIVSEGWLHATSPEWGYFERLPPSLPTDAAVQNLILFILAKIKRKPDGLTKREFASHREVTRRIGLNYGDRNDGLKSALKRASTWFADNGGELTFRFKSDAVTIRFRAPPIES